jgi:hypothetical protein
MLTNSRLRRLDPIVRANEREIVTGCLRNPPPEVPDIQDVTATWIAGKAPGEQVRAPGHLLGR